MSTYEELLKQRATLLSDLAELEQKIEDARKAEMQTVLEQMRGLIGTYKIGQDDLFPAASDGRRASPMRGSRATPKYRDPATGVTWSGRGKAPRWFDRDNPDAFKI